MCLSLYLRTGHPTLPLDSSVAFLLQPMFPRPWAPEFCLVQEGTGESEEGEDRHPPCLLFPGCGWPSLFTAASTWPLLIPSFCDLSSCWHFLLWLYSGWMARAFSFGNPSCLHMSCSHERDVGFLLLLILRLFHHPHFVLVSPGFVWPSSLLNSLTWGY